MRKRILVIAAMGMMCGVVEAGDAWATTGKVLVADKVIEMATGKSPVNAIVGGVTNGVKGVFGGDTKQPVRQQQQQQQYYQPPRQQQQYYQPPQQQRNPVQYQYPPPVNYNAPPRMVKIWQSRIVTDWKYIRSEESFATNQEGDEFRYITKVYGKGPVDKGNYITVPANQAHLYNQPTGTYRSTDITIQQGNAPSVEASVPRYNH